MTVVLPETIEHLDSAIECDVRICMCDTPEVCGHPKTWFQDCPNRAAVMALLVCVGGHETTWAMCGGCLDDASRTPQMFECDVDGDPCREVVRVVPL